MKLNAYQIAATKFAIYPNRGRNLTYPTLGLCSEAGEVAGKIKKIERDDHGVLTPESVNALKSELGDTLWYLASLATELHLTLEDVALSNLSKLTDRQNRAKLTGNGDNR